MNSRKTQVLWTLVGAGLCVAAVVLIVKLTEGSTAAEQDAPTPPMPAPVAPLEAPLPTPEEPARLPVPESPMGEVLPPLGPPSVPDLPTPAPSLPEPGSPTPPAAGGDLPPLPGDPTPPPLPQPSELPKPVEPPAPKPVVEPKSLPTSTYVPSPEAPKEEPKKEDPKPVSPPPTPVPVKPMPTVTPSPMKPQPKPSDPDPRPRPVVPVEHTRPAPKPPVHPPYATHTDSSEPPYDPFDAPVQRYHVQKRGESLKTIAEKTLNDTRRWNDVYKLNARFDPRSELRLGTVVVLPADACIPTDLVEAVKPLPSLRPDKEEPKEKAVLPLTGTFPCMLDSQSTLTLPRNVREQLDFCGNVMISPGPDHCLWITNQAHLNRLSQRLEKSDAKEVDVRIFKRLYYAQASRTPVNADGRIVIPERLSKFAGLYQEVVLVGIDDHFEIWDVARWREYTRTKSVEAREAYKISR